MILFKYIKVLILLESEYWILRNESRDFCIKILVKFEFISEVIGELIWIKEEHLNVAYNCIYQQLV